MLLNVRIAQAAGPCPCKGAEPASLLRNPATPEPNRLGALCRDCCQHYNMLHTFILKANNRTVLL